MDTATKDIVNKVKKSKLETIDLEKWIQLEECVSIDLKDLLYMGLIVKEKEFRHSVDNLDVSIYEGKVVRLFCSVDTIIPKWAWMLIYVKLSEKAEAVHFGSETDLITLELIRKIREYQWSRHKDGFVILKGCSKLKIPDSVYAEAAYQCSVYAKKVMYGEACSNVPIYKSS